MSMSNEEIAVAQFTKRPFLPRSDACGCLGPKNGEPLCPCRMAWTERVNGVLFAISWDVGGWKATEVKP